MPNLRWQGQFKGPIELIAAPQDFTALWVDLGNWHNVEGAFAVALFLELEINDSTDMRVRLLATYLPGGDQFTLPIQTVAAAVVTLQPEYMEFNVDEDRLMAISWSLDSCISSIQVQIQVGAVGAPTAAQVITANLTSGGVG